MSLCKGISNNVKNYKYYTNNGGCFVGCDQNEISSTLFLNYFLPFSDAFKSIFCVKIVTLANKWRMQRERYFA